MTPSTAIADDLLRWYDRHRRTLPWRAPAGSVADPYGVWLSEIMLQQTTVAAVKPYYAAFLTRWPNVEALAAAPREAVMAAWAGLGYYARARNLHECAAAVAMRYGGRFPATEAALRELPGIGDYTAAAVAAIAFGEPAAVVDGNVERVVSRLFAVAVPLPAARPAIRRIVSTLVPHARPGDFAQAMMDLGASLCSPRAPACGVCPLANACLAFAAGQPTAFPKRVPKAERPRRYGIAAVVERADGAVLVRTRPPKGLLGGMTEFLGTDWSTVPPGDEFLRSVASLDLVTAGTVEHVFTHFALTLDVRRGRAHGGPVSGYRWVTPGELTEEPLPGLMTKVLRAARRASLVPVARNGLGLVGLEGADEERRRNGEHDEPEPLRGARQRYELAEAQRRRHDADRHQRQDPPQHGRNPETRTADATVTPEKCCAAKQSSSR